MISGGFPRDLEAAAPLSLPVSVVTIAELTTTAVEDMLGRTLGWTGTGIAKRRLRGCLVAHCGHGIIFLDEDNAGARRFAFAHELAHFVGHYLSRRELAVARLGLGILDVLDARRPATREERLGGILSNCPLGAFGDAIERDGSVPLNPAAELMEAEADEAAFLALSPIGEVIGATIRAEGRVERRLVAEVLVELFGLSPIDAERHAPRVVAASARGRTSLVDSLRQAASETARQRHN